ncbi:MAB_1171c family putative transporter [Streptomyces antimycoticus]|uniref:MAB_1171c family putative transporter n=1 Tax=Streptomyces antimycoticus TaxID=68175 RepID=UPI0036B52B9A
MSSVLYPAIAAVTLLAFLYKLPVLRSDRSAIQLGLVGNNFLIFVIFLTCTHSVWQRINGLSGIVNFSGLFMHVCVVGTTACQQIVILHLAHERQEAWRRLRPRLLAISVGLAVMTLLFFMTKSHEEGPDEFSLTTQNYSAYFTVYLVIYTVNQLDVTVMCWRYAKVASAPWLRRGLYITTFTIPFALVYSAGRLADIIAHQFGATGRAWEPVVGSFISVAALLKTLGWTLPDWGPYLSKAWEPVTARRAFKALEHLHRSLTSHVPDPVIPLGANERLATRLYRMTVEIRDAQWALRTWMNPAVATVAERECDVAGITGDDRAAVIEAAQLKSALEAKSQDSLPPACTDNPRAADPGDYPAELAFQRKLGHAFTESPVVQDVLKQTTTRPTALKEARQ